MRQMSNDVNGIPLSTLAGVVRKFARMVANGSKPETAAKLVGVPAEKARDTASEWMAHPDVRKYLRDHSHMVIVAELAPLALNAVRSALTEAPWNPKLRAAELVLKYALENGETASTVDLEHMTAEMLEHRLSLIRSKLADQARVIEHEVADVEPDNSEDLFA